MPSVTREPLKQLVGAELASVTFVRDYVQLSFDGPRLSALTPMTVVTRRVTVTSCDDQFRNRLCELIGRSITEVDARPDEALTIGFADGSSVSISLRPEHYPGPEAVVFYGQD